MGNMFEEKLVYLARLRGVNVEVYVNVVWRVGGGGG